MGRPHRRAHRARVPEPRRHRRPPRQDPLGRRARPVQLHLRVPRGGRRPRGRPDGGRRSSTTSSRPTTPTVFFDFAPELERLIRLAERQAFGPSTQALIDEAVSRDIPFIRLDRHSLVQFGHGVHQQRIRATMTSQDLGHRRRRRVGQEPDQPAARLRRPAGAARRRRRRPRTRPSPPRSASASRACVKPLDGNHGRGVHLDLRSEEAVRAAFHGALGAEPVGRRRRRDLRRRQRLPLPRHRRQGRGDRRARAGQRDRRRRAHRPPARRHRQRRPAPRHRPREGPDPDQGRRGGRGAGPRPGLRARRRAARGHVDQARADRQHVDRRDVHRPDDRGAPRQRRDRRDRGPHRRARRRRHRLHLPGHRDARARDRRRDRRGQRRARLPDAHPPDRGRAAVRRATGHRRAVPARPAGAHPDHLRDRHQRQDDDGPDDRPHPQADGPAGRDDLDRRHRRRRPAHQEGRHVGPEVGPDGAPEPDRRHRGLRGRPRRDPARGPRLRPQRRGRRDQRDRRPPRPRRDRLDRASWPTSRASSSRPCRVPGTAVLNADDSHVYRMGRHCAGRVVLFSMATEKGEDGFDRIDGHTSPRQRGVLPRAQHGGRADRAPPRQPQDAGAVHAPHPGDVRRPGADERGQRAGRGRGGVGRRARTCTTSARACGRSRPRSSRRRAGSTCSTSAGVRVVIDYCHNVDGMRQLADFVDADDGRAADQGRADRDDRVGGALGPGDRRARHPGRPPRRGPARVRGDRRGRLRRDHRARGQEPARPGAGRDRDQRHRGRPRARRRPGRPVRPGPTRCSTR